MFKQKPFSIDNTVWRRNKKQLRCRTKNNDDKTRFFIFTLSIIDRKRMNNFTEKNFGFAEH